MGVPRALMESMAAHLFPRRPAAATAAAGAGCPDTMWNKVFVDITKCAITCRRVGDGKMMKSILSM